jgi:phage/plasmid-associated DNA primase
LTEGRSIDVTALKQIQDVGQITARYIRQDNFTFNASHSLFATTNYLPVVSETDHGTWRRLALLKFRYTFRKPGEPLTSDADRRGDPTLKARIEHNAGRQHDAIVTWAIEGAMRWYSDQATSLLPTNAVEVDTRAWRTEADRILGFWDERLTADPDHCILAAELLEEFNAWLRGNGHREWPKETFGPRFEQHEMTIRHGVTRAKPRNLPTISRGGQRPFADPPLRPWAYLGVRFQTDADKEQRESGPSGPTPRENRSYAREAGSSQRVGPLGPDPASNADSGAPNGHLRCSDCGIQVPSGHVRCRDCFRNLREIN